MASTGSMLFDSDEASNPPERRVFNVQEGESFLVRAAGLAVGECVPIFVRVGAPGRRTGSPCIGCSVVSDPDYLWTPLTRCGSPVTICEDSAEYIERVPGTYMVGSPTLGVTVAGDVNITGRKLDARYLYVQPYCSGSDAPPPAVCEPMLSRGLQPAW